MTAWVVYAATLLLFAACSGDLTGHGPAPPRFDEARPLRGVPDRGADPAVLSIERNGVFACAGALVLPGVVLSARRCLLPGAPCPAPSSIQSAPASGLSARLIQEGGAASASGREVLLPEDEAGCEADVAALILVRPLSDVEPLGIALNPVALGDRVRTVDLGMRDDRGAPALRVRDHVLVVGASAATFALDEAPCEGGCGGPVVAEATGEFLGLIPEALAGPGLNYDVAMRADALSALLSRAAAASAAPAPPRSARYRTRKGAVDAGSYCQSGRDCAAGVCVTSGPRRYCSRECGKNDRCMPRFTCEIGATAAGPGERDAACVER